MSKWSWSSQYYVVDSDSSDIQQSAEYQDVSELHSYLNSSKNEGEFIPKFEVMNSIMDCFSDLRALAEQEAEHSDWCNVNNQRDELPLSIDTVCKYFEGLSLNTEPPLRMIVKIAEENYNTIGYLINNLHRVLRRDRRMVRVDKAQQLDSQCMAWLSKQPGRNSAQRAGVRQEIMAVVRYESIDTLENRVLKDCLRLCVINAESYMHEFKDCKNSRRLEAVTGLHKLCKTALNNGELDGISPLKTMPVPNYVLLNNVNYNAVWNIYMQLIRRTRLLEAIWRNRHLVFKDMIKLMSFASFHKYIDLADNPIKYQVWVNRFLDNETDNYLSHTNWLYVAYDASSNTQYRMISLSINIRYDWWNNKTGHDKKFSFAYVPDSVDKEIFSNNKILIVFKESPDTVVASSGTGRIIEVMPEDNIIEKLYRIIKEMFFGWSM